MNIFDNSTAFSALDEDLVWQKDRPPRTRTALRGIVLHGSADSESAGHALARMTADPWSVVIPLRVGIVANIRPGDTLERMTPHKATLTVQSVTAGEFDWIITCTANERSPL